MNSAKISNWEIPETESENEKFISGDEDFSNLEIPATDTESDEEKIASIRRKSLASRRNTFQPSDYESSDDEEIIRRRVYLTQGIDEDDGRKIGEHAYAKCDRISIQGFEPQKCLETVEPDDSNDESDCIIIEDSESEADLYDEAVGGVETIKVTTSQYKEIKSKRDEAEAQVNQMLKVLEHAGGLPDRGQKVRARIQTLRREIDGYMKLLLTWTIDESESESVKSEIIKSSSDEPIEMSPKRCQTNYEIDDVKPKFSGKVKMQEFLNQKALTIKKLIDLSKEIESRPPETELATPPDHLRVRLMSHQLHAINFMLWRETKQPRGGIIADDMGIGKTLTAIGLIMKSLQKDEAEEDLENRQTEKTMRLAQLIQRRN